MYAHINTRGDTGMRGHTSTYLQCVCTYAQTTKSIGIHIGLPAGGLPHRMFQLFSHVCACLNTSKTGAIAHHSTVRSAALSCEWQGKKKREKGICEFTTGCWNDCVALAISAHVGFKWLRNLNTVFTPLIQSTDWSVFGKFNTWMRDLKPRGHKKLLTASSAPCSNENRYCEREYSTQPVGAIYHIFMCLKPCIHRKVTSHKHVQHIVK